MRMNWGTISAVSASLMGLLPCSSLGAERLTGLKELKLLIENFNKDAADCGVTKDGIETSARFVLQQTKLKVLPASAVRTAALHFSVVVHKVDELCAAAYKVQILVPGTFEPIYSKSKVPYVYGVWDTYGVIVAPRGTFAHRLADAHEDSTKEFVAEWSKAN